MFDPEELQGLTNILKALQGHPIDQVSLLAHKASDGWVQEKDDSIPAQAAATKGLVMIGMVLVLQHPEWAVAAIDIERKSNPDSVKLAEKLSNLATQIAPIEENDNDN